MYIESGVCCIIKWISYRLYSICPLEFTWRIVQNRLERWSGEASIVFMNRSPDSLMCVFISAHKLIDERCTRVCRVTRVRIVFFAVVCRTPLVLIALLAPTHYRQSSEAVINQVVILNVRFNCPMTPGFNHVQRAMTGISQDHYKVIAIIDCFLFLLLWIFMSSLNWNEWMSVRRKHQMIKYNSYRISLHCYYCIRNNSGPRTCRCTDQRTQAFVGIVDYRNFHIAVHCHTVVLRLLCGFPSTKILALDSHIIWKHERIMTS